MHQRETHRASECSSTGNLNYYLGRGHHHGYHYHHQQQQQQQLNHHTNLQGPQKYRRQQPSDRHGPSQEGLQALADVMIEDYDQNHDEDEV